ncbi:hypothetical protein BAX97_08270 [Elizabethkingia meningoseptica]|uniref:hypothetical protein n=1 Tax=Elizabethkingia meningoseptica TaxID=238 RepID=UPI000999F4B4|nr:hypothetical protein [Elizabethkingia meningoseptica]MDE5488196.1 hypothetical protein [Elizabethkingia meningoseptica]MVW91207.1 hypothetical protein [Elizabethkingia meningoseptica]OPC27729.1 hypothetical protein BAX97_08270 [Elizabethkingia meningoseptica]
MKVKQSIPFMVPSIIIIFTAYLTFSCSGSDADPSDRLDDRGTIMELDAAKFPNVKKDSIEKETYNNLRQLGDIEFFLQLEDSYFGKNTLQTNGKGKELTLQSFTPDDNAQLFYFKFSTDIPYMIYSAKEKTPIGIGSYKRNPNRYVLFSHTSERTALFGFGWNLIPNTDRNKYFLQNHDISDTSTINYVISTQSGELSVEKKNNTIGQQFNIVPNDEFIIEDLQISAKGSEIIESKSIILKQGNVENNTTQEMKRNLPFSESLISTNSFVERMGGILIAKTGSLDIETKLPKVILSGGVPTFGYSETAKLNYNIKSPVTTTFQLNPDITIPSRTILNYKVTVLQHSLRLKYTARCSGVKSGKVINISGVYSGFDYSDPSLETNTAPLK